MNNKNVSASRSKVQCLIKVFRDYPFLLLVLCFGCVIAFLVFTAVADPTPFEAAFFQILILLAGLLGSYIFGRDSAETGAQERVKLQARPAFRRVLALYQSLYDLSSRIGQLRTENDDSRLALIQALVNEHYRTGRDAMEDWRDIAPEYVEQIEQDRTRYDKLDNGILPWDVEQMAKEPLEHDESN